MRRRTFLEAGGVFVVGVVLGEWPRPAMAQKTPGPERFLGKSVDPKQVDAYLAIHADSTVTLFTGKVDLGSGAMAGGRLSALSLRGREAEG